MTLQEYLSTNQITQAAFAREVGATQQGVSLWASGRIPTLKMTAKIEEITKGAVTSRDFLGSSEASQVEAAE